MTMPQQLFLIRHGESEGNVANNKAKGGDLSSFTDEFVTTPGRKWRLTEKGIEQAKLAGAWLNQELKSFDVPSVRRYYVSPYTRTMQTAGHLELEDPAQGELEWYVNRTIRERDWGDIDSTPKIEFQADPVNRLNVQKMNNDPLYWRPPGGESIQDVAENRVRNFLDTLHRECGEGLTVAVTHGEFMQAARIVLERIDDSTYDYWESSKTEKIHNCMILQYSKFDPRKPRAFRVPGSRLQFLRKIYPVVEEGRMEVGPWVSIDFSKPTNSDLLKV